MTWLLLAFVSLSRVRHGDLVCLGEIVDFCHHLILWIVESALHSYLGHIAEISRHSGSYGYCAQRVNTCLLVGGRSVGESVDGGVGG